MQCQKCQKPVNGDKNTCGKCFSAIYCDRNCQVADWKSHKLFCSSLSPSSLFPNGNKEEGDKEETIINAISQSETFLDYLDYFHQIFEKTNATSSLRPPSPPSLLPPSNEGGSKEDKKGGNKEEEVCRMLILIPCLVRKPNSYRTMVVYHQALASLSLASKETKAKDKEERKITAESVIYGLRIISLTPKQYGDIIQNNNYIVGGPNNYTNRYLLRNEHNGDHRTVLRMLPVSRRKEEKYSEITINLYKMGGDVFFAGKSMLYFAGTLENGKLVGDELLGTIIC